MKLISLKIRGAIGLEAYGDEVFIPFDQFASGPIAIVGENGSGKTTLLESLHPWPTMVSRSGALAGNYRLRDSARELRFELGGVEYLSKILLDGDKKKIEAYLYRGEEPLNDGKTPSYKALVADLFGDPELFFRSIFLSQHGSRISELRPGESKEFFVGLLGLGKYQDYVAASKERAGELEGQRVSVAAAIEQIERQVEANGLKLADRPEVEAKIVELEKVIQAAEDELERLAAELKEAELAKAERLRLQERITEIDRDITTLGTERADLSGERTQALEKIDKQIDGLSREAAALSQHLAEADSIRTNARRFTELTTRDGELKELEQKLKELNVRRESLLFKARSGRDAELSDLSRRIGEMLHEKQSMESSIASQRKSVTDLIDRLKREIESNRALASKIDIVPCRDTAELVSACPLIASAREARENIAGLEARLAETEQFKDKTLPEENQLRELGEQIKALKKEETDTENKELPSSPELLEVEREIEAISYDEAEHRDVCEKLWELGDNDWAKLAGELDVAESKLDGLRRQVESLQEQRTEKGRDYDQRLSSLDSRVSGRVEEKGSLKQKLAAIPTTNTEDIRSRKSGAERGLSASKMGLGEAKGSLKALDDLATENERLKTDLDERRMQIGTIKGDITDWRLLETACGKNGLQALELDSAMPEISAIATEVLQGFGRGWSVSISTLRDSSDNKREIETFEIITSSPKGVRKFDLLSGGEQVWIEESLRKAVALYLIRHSGREFKTLFQDEADGALDPERAQAFLETAFRAHEMTNAHHTILISQRPEVWGRIPQRLHLDPTAGKIELVMN